MGNHHGHPLTQPSKVNLKGISTLPPGGITKEEALAEVEELGQEMEELLDLLFYAGQQSLLIVLQGMDTSGKDGTIRHLLTHSNAQSLRVSPFKVPTELELSHDFLWRIHAEAPGKGHIGIFNRSHYEDVLVVRVHDLVPESKWSKRYKAINHFESHLAENDTLILKFFLHISKDEQEKRLLEREQEVEKAWKLSAGDWKEREFWDDYQEAYEAALGECASPEAPWVIVPADKKWYRNLVVTQAIVDALKPHRDGWHNHLKKIGEEAKAELATLRAKK